MFNKNSRDRDNKNNQEKEYLSSDHSKAKNQIEYYSFQINKKKISSMKKYDKSTNNKMKFLRNDNSIKFGEQIKIKLPWITDKTVYAPSKLKLHFEILDLYSYIKPSEKEKNLRDFTVKLLKNVITDRWPTWNVNVFGSYIIDLFLKDSDIDISISKSTSLNFSTNEFTDYDDFSEVELLYLIFKELIDKKFSNEENCNIILAKVPIIKCVCSETGIKIDISINQINGLKNAQIMNQLLINYPVIKPIVLLMKFILKQKNLHEAYTGGIGSFVVFNMVYAYFLYLIRINKLNVNSKEPYSVDENKEYSKLKINKYFDIRRIDKINDLGTFFYGFLNFYGYEFDYENYGISNFRLGQIFAKSESKNFYNNANLCILNFLDDNHNISSSSFKYQEIVSLMQSMVSFLYEKQNFLFEDLKEYESPDECEKELEIKGFLDLKCEKNTYENKNYSFFEEILFIKEI